MSDTIWTVTLVVVAVLLVVYLIWDERAGRRP